MKISTLQTILGGFAFLIAGTFLFYGITQLADFLQKVAFEIARYDAWFASSIMR